MSQAERDALMKELAWIRDNSRGPSQAPRRKRQLVVGTENAAKFRAAAAKPSQAPTRSRQLTAHTVADGAKVRDKSTHPSQAPRRTRQRG